MPTLYNDEAVCPALENLGIPPKDAHLYVMNGCNQIDIQGKSHMGLEDGEVNIAKAVEFTLHNGVSEKTGQQLSHKNRRCLLDLNLRRILRRIHKAARLYDGCRGGNVK